ncbi:MAG: transcription-repair coupling factor [Pirellulaceae bacterium]|nr:transcription-repair coupling factor [Pirellulaceae bacterium]
MPPAPRRPAVLSVTREKRAEALTLAEVIRLVSDLPALAAAQEQLGRDGQLTLEGVWLGALPPLIAAWTRRAPQTVLLVLSHLAEAEAVASELSELTHFPVVVFPPGSEDSQLQSLTHQETGQRLQVLSQLYKSRSAANRATPHPHEQAANQPLIVVTTLPSMQQSVPAPQSLEGDQRLIRCGVPLDAQDLRQWLIQAGYHATGSVQMPGEFAMRGGILDIYPPDEPQPVRIELFGDDVESLRRFDVATQRSIQPLNELQLLAATGSIQQDGCLADYLPTDCLIIVHEPGAVQAAAEAFMHRVAFPERFHSPRAVWQTLAGRPLLHTSQLAIDGYSGQLTRLPIGNVERIGGDLDRLAEDIDRHANARAVIVVALNDGERQRLSDLLADSAASTQQRLWIEVSQLQHGFELLGGGPLVLTANQLLRRSHVRRVTKRLHSRPIDNFLDLRPGDLVVHLSHGIGAYRGTELLDKNGQRFEHLVIEFDGGTKLYVPSSKIELVQRYVGGTKSRPKLAKIGGASWAKQKQAAARAVADMAVELLELQARRRTQPGIAFAQDSVWQSQFDASFSYVETPDQLRAIADVKQDMTRSRPMDRLICGDVGFGKTEVAMRAAFKAVDSGYQVAVLVPTTVLAEQHYKTFRQRMAEFPFDIEKLSRFVGHAEQARTLEGLRTGRVDIVVGTHRLASQDVQFYNLGMLIIDEEQRFGVEMKERLKHLKSNVDVLTLSATPIPRTLHMSLVGVRDISNLETPPEDRLSIETRTIRFDEQIIRNAILRELNRDGQVYFVHNRVQDIMEVAGRLQHIVPDARIVIGHGQMPEGQLEQVMIDFIEHRYDILLSTTIIESGLDIPNANTIFIDEAYRYGLAELHQLRGRVGRYKHQAYCYLVVERHKHLSPDATRRLHAIEEYSQIGAGFGIAMRDLEIRGAGNLLGTQQSGHIAAVGYEFYCQLLASAVRQLTHQPPKLTVDVDIDLPVEAYLPTDYVPELRQRIDFYRRLSRIADVRELDDLREELKDRFGELPECAGRLLELAELRIDASLWLIKSLQTEDHYLVMTYTNRGRIEHLAKLHDRRLRIVDQHKAYWITQGNPNIDWLREARTAFRTA